MAWIWTAVLVIILIYLLQQLLKNLDNKKKLPPGPIALPILGHIYLFTRNPHHLLHRLAQKHGPIMSMRLGYVPAIVVSSPSAAKLVLKTHDLVFAGRPRLLSSKYISYDQRNITFASYGAYWRNMRKLCTLELLSHHKIKQFQAMRSNELRVLVSSLKRAGEKRETVDISARVSGLSGDMTCLMVFGRKFADKYLDEKGFKCVIEEGLQVIATPNLGNYFPLLGFLDVQGLRRRMKKVSETFDKFLEKIIDEHVEKKQKKESELDFVDTMMRIMESGEAGFEFDRRHVKAVLLDMLVAGSDTSSTTVEWALSELIRHPKIMKKLQNELENIVGMDQLVDESHLDKLEYLDFVIKETFRLHPVVPLIIHESLEDCIIDEFHIPKGTRLIVNALSIGRDPSAWQDPDRFMPDRFSGSNVDLVGNDFELIPFGSGRRRCPGMNLGLTMVRLVLAQLVHCFDFELPNGELVDDLDMSDHFGLVTSRNKHLMAIPTYRLCK